MPDDRLIDVLTQIRDQQKQQLQNFEATARAQEEYVELQRKGRKLLHFMVAAPWIALCLVGLRFLLPI